MVIYLFYTIGDLTYQSPLVLSTPVRQGLKSCLVPPGVPTKTLHTTLLSSICAMYTAYRILRGLIIITVIFSGTNQEPLRYAISSSPSSNVLHTTP